jgi:hypothetical protein
MDALLELAAIYGRKQMVRIAKLFGRTFETNIPTINEDATEWRDVIMQMEGVDEIVGGEGVLDLMDWCMVMDPMKRKSAGEILEASELLKVDGRRFAAK